MPSYYVSMCLIKYIAFKISTCLNVAKFNLLNICNIRFTVLAIYYMKHYNKATAVEFTHTCTHACTHTCIDMECFISVHLYNILHLHNIMCMCVYVYVQRKGNVSTYKGWLRAGQVTTGS